MSSNANSKAPIFREDLLCLDCNKSSRLFSGGVDAMRSGERSACRDGSGKQGVYHDLREVRIRSSCRRLDKLLRHSEWLVLPGWSSQQTRYLSERFAFCAPPTAGYAWPVLMTTYVGQPPALARSCSYRSAFPYLRERGACCPSLPIRPQLEPTPTRTRSW